MIIVGIDIGGTFTDIVIFDSEVGKLVGRFKVLSTPKNPLLGVKAALDKLKGMLGNVDLIVHATTIATNAILGQVGLELPKAALITTRGFRDVLEIGRQKRPEVYNIDFEKPKPLIPRKYRLEVNERTLADGTVLIKPSSEELDSIINFIIKEKIETIAISFLHSYANPTNERYVAEYLRSKLRIPISISSEVDNQYREYERTSTTVVNAILIPLVSKYISELQNTVAKYYNNAKVVIMKSDGGIGDPDYISKRPVSIIESGPAAGVVAAKLLGDMLGIKNIISFDMGGTTAKAGIIVGGSISITTEYEVGGKVHSGRIIKGSGYPVRYPFIDLAEISAGGGSIIWVDEAGALKVGPLSAGSDPGPACYGRGGEDPTITDAHLVLGRLDEDSFLYGEFKVSKELALEAFKRLPIDNLDVSELAIGAIKIANFSMAKVLKVVTVERGLDPRDFTLVAFGGGGPMHACPLAEDLGFSRIIVPVLPGVFSAFGLSVTDFKYEYLEPIMRRLEDSVLEDIRVAEKKLMARAIEDLSKLGFDRKKIALHYYLDMRYEGQGYELLINYNPGEGAENLAKKFEEKHLSVYGYKFEGAEIEIVNIRLEAIGSLGRFVLRKIGKRGETNPREALVEKREVYFECVDDYLKASVYRRDKLLARDIIEGPAIIMDYDSTIVVDPQWVGKIDDYGNIVLERV